MTNQPKTTNPAPISDMLEQLWVDAANRGAFELNPDVVAGWVEMALGAMDVLVTAKRGKYPHDPALNQTVEEHLEHAKAHVDNAFGACDGDNDSFYAHSIDDDGIHHIHHATARVALTMTRKVIVEREKASRPKMTFVCDSSEIMSAIGRVSELNKALIESLQREGLADADGNAIPCVPKSEKKPVVVIGMDGSDCYRATKTVEKKYNNICSPGRSVHGRLFGIDDNGKVWWLYGDGITTQPSRVVGTVSVNTDGNKPATCQSKPERAADGKDGGFAKTERQTPSDKPFAPTGRQTCVGTAVDGAKKGELVAVGLTPNRDALPGDFCRMTFAGIQFPTVRVGNKDCASEKCTGEPNYSARCDEY